MKYMLLFVMVLLTTCSSNSAMDKASCSDGIKNGNETGIDCGGDCGNCQEIGVRIPNAGYNAPSSYTGYSLFWNDEFSSNKLDVAKWNYNLENGCPSLCGWGNSELQSFTNSDENLYMKSGNLIIEAIHDGNTYSSGRINTDNKFEFKYGRVDVRVAMPSVSGTWAALFMLNKNYTISDPGKYWPSGGEIDIVEYLGENHNDILGTGHYGSDFPTNHRYNSKHYGAQNGTSFNEAYYVYSIVWEENKITWLVNNVEYHSMTPQATALNGQPYPFNDEFYFVFALSVGGNLTQVHPVSANFPDYLIVDYIRIYKKNE